jgi:hypothetical protein
MSGTHKAGNSADRLAADLEKTRARLTESVSEFEDYIRPSQVASRSIQKVSDYFVNEKGQIRPERAAIAAAALLGLIGLITRDRD